jgi:L-ectoine synthase
MLYTNKQQLIGSEREASGEGWKSRRFLLADDGLPFSFHETEVAAGTALDLCYQNHSETVYCLRGRAKVEDVNGGRVLEIQPGAFYVARRGDHHILRILEDCTFVCVFEPPLLGQEEAD